ncbi:hypothetical protein HFP15_00300 [Amycolatopsis sp. K13G38]|uniref:Uncharacterized protein n=1 Tax=Amycolatopsis acididurans TaxID=2724524 RepID=A0ABX1IYW8_9PSEU|nr:hypothetical protein [Amycolatopsis acididurans]NKQ51320.1 hypothetical protein [Amycolatopsis acididurans]
MGERETNQQAGGTEVAGEPTPIFEAVSEAIRRLLTDNEHSETGHRS